jgi:hypothetical protein
MYSHGPLDALPLWGLFMATLLLVLLSVEGGYRLGKYRRSRSEEEKEAPVGAMAGATLGLLAFMLAFTFGLAAARFDTRRQLLLDEANAIGTTYLRAGMLPDRRENIRALLRDYVDARLEAVRSGNVTEGIRRSEHLQGQLWAQAVALGENNPTSIVVGLFVQSLNEVIDLHAKRVTAGLRNRIPGVIWGAFRSRRPFSRRHGLSRWPLSNEAIARRACRRLHIFCGHRAHCGSRPTARRIPESEPAGTC